MAGRARPGPGPRAGPWAPRWPKGPQRTAKGSPRAPIFKKTFTKKTSFLRKTTRRRQDSTRDQDFYKNKCHFPEKRPAGGRIAPETRTFTKRRHFSEKRPAGGNIALETKTFTNKNNIFQKNNPPEARWVIKHTNINFKNANNHNKKTSVVMSNSNISNYKVQHSNKKRKAQKSIHIHTKLLLKTKERHTTTYNLKK